jgi:hypothetical protein
MMLTAEELLAGSSLTFETEIPQRILRSTGSNGGNGTAGTVRLRPLTVQDLQLISRAAKESDSLVATLMVQRSLVEPALTVAEVASMHVGLVQFLLDQVNQISGVTATAEQLAASMEAPLAKAAFVLAKEYGWTPEEVNDLTLGQILLHLQMLKERSLP